ncbi:DUF3667 domain-containing protein [Ekhidna sp. To15]|uniref:DUF3667 domain-containing protein n=1 Tax=Ekhidna sp. To15 TaxID=3395267 RepID=UPI003F5260A3
MPDATSKHCLNCNTILTGNYCQECGQSAKIQRITFKEAIDDFFSSTFALQGPLLFTLRSLIVKPGRMFREFVAGRRKTYYKPVAFFIVLTAFFLILKALMDYDPLARQFQQTNEEIHPQVLKFKNAATFMVTHINNIMLILVFSIASNLKLFFRKRYNFTEYSTIGFYITGIYILFTTGVMLIDNYLVATPKVMMFVFLAFYIIYSCSSFFQPKSFLEYFKYLFVAIFSIILYITAGFALSYLIVNFQS